MLDRRMNQVLRHLRVLSDVREEGDADLLGRFVAAQDEAAFEALVRRHGAMVLGVCRRVLRCPQDAEDAFQATFLVLARKAASVRKRASLGSFLHGTAYRIAVKGRARERRRHEREPLAPATATPDALEEIMGRELRALLDEELSRLPDKYSGPLILCDLEGKSQEEAARALGYPPGSMSRWLARGRELLRERLARRGIVVPAGMLTAVLVEESARAGLTASLVAGTVRAAGLFVGGQVLPAGVVSARVLTLAQGGLKAMSLMRVKVAAVVLLAVGVVGTGVGLAGHRGAPPAVPKDERPPAPAGDETAALKEQLRKVQKELREAQVTIRSLKNEVARLRGDAAGKRRGAIQVRFGGPRGARVTLVDTPSPGGKKGVGKPLELPGRWTFPRAGTYRLKVFAIPKRPGLELYPSMELLPPTAATADYLAHTYLRVSFTDEDIDRAVAGGLVVKALYLAFPHLGEGESGPDEIVSTRLEPGVDAVAEAKRRGHLLAVVRLGGIDLEAPPAPAKRSR